MQGMRLLIFNLWHKKIRRHKIMHTLTNRIEDKRNDNNKNNDKSNNNNISIDNNNNNDNNSNNNKTKSK